MIYLTPAAIGEINRIKSKQSRPDALLRLGVKPGGCAELYYTVELDEAIGIDDQVQTCGSVRIVTTAESGQYLDGLKIDYTEDLMGGGFRFDNPNAANSCGCGNSFAMNN